MITIVTRIAFALAVVLGLLIASGCASVKVEGCTTEPDGTQHCLSYWSRKDHPQGVQVEYADPATGRTISYKSGSSVTSTADAQAVAIAVHAALAAVRPQ